MVCWLQVQLDAGPQMSLGFIFLKSTFFILRQSVFSWTYQLNNSSENTPF